MQPGRRIPRQRLGIDDARRGAWPCGDEQLRRGELIELADDAVSGSAGQAHCRHQRRHSDHHAQHGQDHASGPRENPGECFVQEVADSDSRPRRGGSSAHGRQGDRLWRQRLARMFLDHAVDDVNAARGTAGDVLVMRDDNDRQTFPVQTFQAVEDVRRTLRVQVAGGFVAQQQTGRADQGARNRDALPFAAGQFARQEVDAMRQADPFDRSEGAVPPAAGGPAAVHLRQHHVLKHCPVRQQVERLEHEPDALAPQTCALLVGQCGRFHAVQSVEAVGRAIQAADDVQQRRFAGAGRPRDRQPLAPLQREIDINERMNCRLSAGTACRSC